MTTLIGSTASEPYTSMKGVSHVVLFSVVRMDQSIAGSSSAHSPLVASNLFFKPFKICLLGDSTCLLVWGLATAVNHVCMP